MNMSLKFQRLRAFLRWYEREMPRQAGHDKGVRLLEGNSQGLTVTRVSACGNLLNLLKQISPIKAFVSRANRLFFDRDVSFSSEQSNKVNLRTRDIHIEGKIC